MLNILFWSCLGFLCALALFQLGRIWGDYIAPLVRDWRYERRMEKARERFYRQLFKELEKAKRK